MSRRVTERKLLTLDSFNAPETLYLPAVVGHVEQLTAVSRHGRAFIAETAYDRTQLEHCRSVHVFELRIGGRSFIDGQGVVNLESAMDVVVSSTWSRGEELVMKLRNTWAKAAVVPALAWLAVVDVTPAADCVCGHIASEHTESGACRACACTRYRERPLLDG